MLTATAFGWIAACGFCLLTLASLGASMLYQISWHELKEYCIRREMRSKFDTIRKSHDDVILGLESLRAVGFSIVVVAAAGWFAESLHESAAASLTTLGLGVLGLVLVVCVWIPGAIADQWSTEVTFYCWRAFHMASFLVLPLSLGTKVLEKALRRMGNQEDLPTDEEAFEDEVLAIVTEGMHEGHLEADAREMIEGVIELGDLDVADIMTPRSNIDSIKLDAKWPQVIEFVVSCGRTRIPVCDDSLDSIIGILYVKDLLGELSDHHGVPKSSLRQLLREPWYVPPTKKLDDLLSEFLQTRSHLAIVRDEFSRVAGLVTIEDVLEEIVGEIVDETDKEQVQEIHLADAKTALIQGRAHLTEVNEQLGLELPESEDFDTMAGYVVNHVGRIPKSGEQFVLEQDELRLTILHANKRKVQRVQLESLNGNLRTSSDDEIEPTP